MAQGAIRLVAEQIKLPESALRAAFQPALSMPPRGSPHGAQEWASIFTGGDSDFGQQHLRFRRPGEQSVPRKGPHRRARFHPHRIRIAFGAQGQRANQANMGRHYCVLLACKHRLGAIQRLESIRCASCAQKHRRQAKLGPCAFVVERKSC